MDIICSIFGKLEYTANWQAFCLVNGVILSVHWFRHMHTQADTCMHMRTRARTHNMMCVVWGYACVHACVCVDGCMGACVCVGEGSL